MLYIGCSHVSGKFVVCQLCMYVSSRNSGIGGCSRSFSAVVHLCYPLIIRLMSKVLKTTSQLLFLVSGFPVYSSTSTAVVRYHACITCCTEDQRTALSKMKNESNSLLSTASNQTCSTAASSKPTNQPDINLPLQHNHTTTNTTSSISITQHGEERTTTGRVHTDQHYHNTRCTCFDPKKKQWENAKHLTHNQHIHITAAALPAVTHTLHTTHTTHITHSTKHTQLPYSDPIVNHSHVLTHSTFSL